MITAFYYDKLDKNSAKKLALHNNHLEGIKYVFSSRGESYLNFYDEYVNNTQALQIAEQLKDLNGITYLINKISGKLLSFLYDSLNSIDKKLAKAENLNHLEGFKYIMHPTGHSYIDTLYPDTTDLNKIANQLYYASVELEDRDGIRYIIKQCKTKALDLPILFDTHRHIMQGIYYKELLGIASLLIKNGAIFDAQDIIRPNLRYSYTEYEKHHPTTPQHDDQASSAHLTSTIVSLSHDSLTKAAPD